MTPRKSIDPRTLEQFSAHLDGRLTPAEADELNRRLDADPALRAAFDELQIVRALLRSLPVLRPRRPLTIHPAMLGERKSFAPTSLGFTLSSAMAAVLLAMTALPAFLQTNQLMAAAPAAPAVFSERMADGYAGSSEAAIAGTKSPMQPLMAPGPLDTPAAVLPANETQVNAPTESVAGSGAADTNLFPTGTPSFSATSIENPPAEPDTAPGYKMGEGGEAPTSLPPSSADTVVSSLPAQDWILPLLRILFGGTAILLAVLAIRARRAGR